MPDTPRLSPLAAQGSEVNRSGELEVLVLVAEQGSLSAAARQMGVSPSAISKTLSRLEARLGVQLLTRSTRRVQLTAEGAQLAARGKQVLAELDDIEATVAARRPVARNPIATQASAIRKGRACSGVTRAIRNAIAPADPAAR